MNTITHQIIEKITNDVKTNLEDLILVGRDISKFIINTGKPLDKTGVQMVKEALEMLDETVRNSKERKQKYYIQRRNNKKTLITRLREINYLRTYYKSKKDGPHEYLSDTMVGIEPYESMDPSYEAEPIKGSIDDTY